MDNPVIASLINFAAALLIFSAAIIPVALSIWSSAKTPSDKANMISKIFVAVSILLNIGVVASFLVLGFGSIIPIALLLVAWLYKLFDFCFDPLPTHKFTVAALIFYSACVSTIVSFFVINKVINSINSSFNQLVS